MREDWRKNYIYILCVLVTLPFGFLFGILVTDWTAYKAKFFEVGFIQILQAVIPILLAFFVTKFVSESINDHKNIKEIILSLLNDFRDQIRDNFQLIRSYIDNPSPELETQILAAFTEANFELRDIQDIENHKISPKFHIESCIEEELLKLKKLTTEPFKKKNPTFSEATKRQIHLTNHLLLQKINLARCKTFK